MRYCQCALGNGSFSINAASFTGSTSITNISAGTVSITLAGKDQAAFSAGVIDSTGSITLTQAQASSGSITGSTLDASGAITIGLGAGTGSGNVAVSGVISTGAFSLSGDQYSDVTLNNVTASASLTINMGGSGSITASSLNTGVRYLLQRP